MKTQLFTLSLFCMMMAPAPLMAADDVPPPPQVDVDNLPDETPPAESDVNLREELEADGNAGGDVRSYQRDGATYTEYSVHGRVYKIKVQPAGGMPAYYLYDTDGDGTFDQRLPGGGKRIAPPTWVLKEF